MGLTTKKRVTHLPGLEGRQWLGALAMGLFGRKVRHGESG